MVWPTRKTNEVQVDRRCELMLNKPQDAALIRADRTVLFSGPTEFCLWIESLHGDVRCASDAGSPQNSSRSPHACRSPRPGPSFSGDSVGERPAIFPPVAGTLVRPARLCAGGCCLIPRHDCDR